MIQKSSGDIFQQAVDGLVCPVNTIGVMGAGLARSFRDRHPDLYYYYKAACRDGSFHPDTLAIHVPHEAPYFVLLMPTKQHFKDPSSYDQVARCIDALATVCRQRQWSSIAIPPVGCGLGGLDFHQQIQPKIIDACESLDTTVVIVEPQE